jgi:hypothetical protein
LCLGIVALAPSFRIAALATRQPQPAQV